MVEPDATVNQSPARCHAWLLTTLGGLSLAVNDREMIEYHTEPQLFEVPLALRYCSWVMRWRDTVIPLINYGLIFNTRANKAVTKVGVLAYQTQPLTPLNYVALALAVSPARIEVDDSSACDLPEYYGGHLAGLAKSCFTHNGTPTVILNIAYLCSAGFAYANEKPVNISNDSLKVKV